MNTTYPIITPESYLFSLGTGIAEEEDPTRAPIAPPPAPTCPGGGTPASTAKGTTKATARTEKSTEGGHPAPAARGKA